MRRGREEKSPVTSNQDRSYSHLNSIVPLASVEFSSRYGPGMDLPQKHQICPHFPRLEIYAIGATSSLSLAREKNTQVFRVSRRDIEEALATKVEIEIHTDIDEVYNTSTKVISTYHLSRTLE